LKAPDKCNWEKRTLFSIWQRYHLELRLPLILIVWEALAIADACSEVFLGSKPKLTYGGQQYLLIIEAVADAYVECG
jgi:hypothetical protein